LFFIGDEAARNRVHKPLPLSDAEENCLRQISPAGSKRRAARDFARRGRRRERPVRAGKKWL